MTDTQEDFARHNARMKRVQAVRERMQARRTLERGLLIVHTGNGKGKSSSAFGMAIRSLGWGMKVGIVQYVKGSWETGEKNFFQANPDLLTFEVMGEGFTWDTQDRAKDIAAARAAWERSKQLILDPDYDFIILDELNIVLRQDTLPIDEIVAFLNDRPLTKHICITGRSAKPELIAIADLVTEFGEVKHPYKAGFKAQKGVEY
ncbi:cob(I)yrinic acid a,c-diamide adenosyltransferase [Sphingomonas ursincola]|jgi:cob(I)alamin adenosyltransferase|uniref:Corrinoid adenosyltransferase n=1 Tax=Sphingomonas ursincola TaxID=56361 RepID=A0A7V8REM6_9SPHN|nr:cob(I)yrinic acid a,c-diamide adenosyltransferase [Sphingomonas ursincola]MBA1375043.1 cob(I)yrinic acid a,c-diamide adenosyltransferase [Sphingomonas ursincola]MBA4780351.1 cob(I)yrinic acid a,c-diamide adenosyltransferase [Blastomonas sp.]MCH2236531.1 cob(I)yrinic acid a,c-diamide adenosyltransferase [Blastomonas sp.]OHD02632.1 MAG: cob(I)yrinic acid a,c-diamide adenosyltransferase [Sphingopyxis sp. RIFCSPHIGHO2_01_FULL_65_24]